MTRNQVDLLTKLSHLIVVLLVVVSPMYIVAVLIGLWLQGGDHSINAASITPWMWVPPIVAGVSLVALRIFSLEREERLELQLQFQYYRAHFLSAWSWGVGVSSVFAGLLLMTSDGSNFHELSTAVIGLVIALVGGVFGVNALYWRNAPYRDLFRLLEDIGRDLAALPNSAERQRVWIVYQALNLGYYREAYDKEGRETHERSRYQDFKGKVIVLADKLGPNARAVTYQTDLYESYFRAYLEPMENGLTANGVDLLTRARDCAKEASMFAEEFAAEGRHHVVAAGDDFPSELVLIGDTLYFIVTHGLPLAQAGAFHPLAGQKTPAVVLAYRREDPGLANIIEEHLIKRFEPQALPIHTSAGSRPAIVGPPAAQLTTPASPTASSVPS